MKSLSMSWMPPSLPNDHQHEYDVVPNDPSPTSTSSPNKHHLQQQQPRHNELILQEDLHAFKRSLSRRFRGMTSFLSPSFPSRHRHTQSFPSHSSVSVSRNEHESDTRRIRRVFSSIQDSRFHRHVPPDICDEHSKLNSISFGSESMRIEEYDFGRAFGITDEVLAFAQNIAMHPETWLDYPVDEEDDTQDFDMSDAQQEHAMAIERLYPRFAALRIELCPCHMSENYFWKVYFVLLHSRLNKQDAEVLSTPQVLAARALWMEELHKQEKLESECFGRSISYSRSTASHEDFSPRFFDNAHSSIMPHGTYRFEEDNENDKHAGDSSEAQFINEAVVGENSNTKTEDKEVSKIRSFKFVLEDYEDEDDGYEWPEDEIVGVTLPVVNEDDISFSDLEDDNYSLTPVKSKTESRAP